MARLKLNTSKDPRLRSTKHDLLKTLAETNGIYEAKDALVISTSTDHEIDKLLEPTNTHKLQENDFHPILPQEVKARRTIICYRVDDIAYENNNENIADQVEERQDWAKVHSVFKFPNNTAKRNNIKIEFDSLDGRQSSKRRNTTLRNIDSASPNR